MRQALALIALGSGLMSSPCAAGPVVGRYPAGPEEAGDQGRANLVYALSRIQTVTGETALQRMQACGFNIRWGSSWVARQLKDMPAYGTSAGDITVQVIFDHRDPKSGRDLLARWYIQKGRVVPNAGWARVIQTSPKPMNAGSLATRC